MSSFLKRIVEKNLEQIPVVKPRPVSVFEQFSNSEISENNFDNEYAHNMSAPADFTNKETVSSVNKNHESVDVQEQINNYKPEPESKPPEIITIINKNEHVNVQENSGPFYIVKNENEKELVVKKIRQPDNELPIEGNKRTSELNTVHVIEKNTLNSFVYDKTIETFDKTREIRIHEKENTAEIKKDEKRLAAPVLRNREKLVPNGFPVRQERKEFLKHEQNVRSQPPVMISIGKVEIRAVNGNREQKVAPVKRQETSPALSLNEYLEKKRGSFR